MTIKIILCRDYRSGLLSNNGRAGCRREGASNRDLQPTVYRLRFTPASSPRALPICFAHFVKLQTPGQPPTRVVERH
jgi:hypothetical protein